MQDIALHSHNKLLFRRISTSKYPSAPSLDEGIATRITTRALRIKDSDGHWADDDLVLQHDADHQEDEVQHEHEESQQLAHPPLAQGDGDDDEEEHEEEQNDGAEQPITAHRHRTHVVRR